MSRFVVFGLPGIFWVDDIEAIPRPREPGRMCPSQFYLGMNDAMAVRNWMAERELGYPSLKQFEGGANWPVFDDLQLFGPPV